MGGATILIRLEGVQTVVTDERGNTYRGEDARRFIEQNLGPDSGLPIAEMRYWLVGAPAPELPFRETIAEGGALSSLEQSGWTVSYERHRAVGSLALPERVEMTTEGLRLRVVISDWRLGP
jgi:outer membrane lipoprotein LolB